MIDAKIVIEFMLAHQFHSVQIDKAEECDKVKHKSDAIDCISLLIVLNRQASFTITDTWHEDDKKCAREDAVAF
jgi:hypothetical protein